MNLKYFHSNSFSTWTVFYTVYLNEFIFYISKNVVIELLPSLTCVCAGHVSAAAGEEELELFSPAERSCEGRERRAEAREPAAEAPAASALGRHDGQRAGRAPRSAHHVTGPDHHGPPRH